MYRGPLFLHPRLYIVPYFISLSFILAPLFCPCSNPQPCNLSEHAIVVACFEEEHGSGFLIRSAAATRSTFVIMTFQGLLREAKFRRSWPWK